MLSSRSGARVRGVPPSYHALSPPPPALLLDSGSVSHLRRTPIGASLFSSPQPFLLPTPVLLLDSGSISNLLRKTVPCGGRISKQATPPPGTPKQSSFRSRRAVCLIVPLLYGGQQVSRTSWHMPDENHRHQLGRSTRLVQVHLNCPEPIYRQNGPISDPNNRPRRRPFVGVIRALVWDIWNVAPESEPQSSLPSLQAAPAVAATSPTSASVGTFILASITPFSGPRSSQLQVRCSRRLHKPQCLCVKCSSLP